MMPGPACALLWIALLGPPLPAGPPVAEPLPEPRPGPVIDLVQALEMADARNLGLEAARTEILSARAGFKRAWSALLPTAAGEMDYVHNDHEDAARLSSSDPENPQRIVVRRQDSLSGSLSVTLPLVEARSWYGISMGDKGVTLAELGVEGARQAVLMAVAQAYFTALTSEALIEVQRSGWDSATRHLEVARIRFRSGTGSRLDLIRAETELVSIREQMISALAAHEAARDSLATLIGFEKAGGELPLPAPLPELREPAERGKALEDRALEQREDLRLARVGLSLADEQLGQSWMSFLPSLYASWQLSYLITEPASLGSVDRSRWFIGLTLSVPIYDHTRYADLDEKRAALHRARLELEDAERQMRLELRQARRDYRLSLEQVACANRKVSLCRETLQLAESAYVHGTGSSLDVTDARRSLRDAEIDLHRRRLETQLALLALLRKAGTDLSTLGEEPR
ncbi:MAG: TolC family protein [Deltaproteobacteria bacterium]|nr:TolC family protein [Deltaproteobacteria bacterium]